MTPTLPGRVSPAAGAAVSVCMSRLFQRYLRDLDGISDINPMDTIFGVDWLQALLSSFPMSKVPMFDNYWIIVGVFNILPSASLIAW